MDHELLLKTHGIRPTRHRVAITRLLFAGGNRHVTAESVYTEARAAGLPVVLATVYNTLNQLLAAGVITEVRADAERTWFDTRTDSHFHYYNEATGELTDGDPSGFPPLHLPDLPEGTELARIEVVVRVRPRA